MANVLFISDLHLGHKGVERFRPNYKDYLDMRDDLYAKWHSKVGKRDIVYILGDACFTQEALDDFKTWKGKKILICGNHDLDREVSKMEDLCKCYDEVYSFLKYKEFWLSHCPIHPDELRGKHNIHGHTHNHVIQDNRYVNVCVEQVGGVPISLLEIRERKLKEM